MRKGQNSDAAVVRMRRAKDLSVVRDLLCDEAAKLKEDPARLPITRAVNKEAGKIFARCRAQLRAAARVQSVIGVTERLQTAARAEVDVNK